MTKKRLRERLDEGLARAQAELEDLPDEYSEESWEKHQAILAKIRELVSMKALFTKMHEPRTETEWGLLY